VRQFGDQTKRQGHGDQCCPAGEEYRHPDRPGTRVDLTTVLQAVVAAKQLFMVDAAGIMLADAHGKLRWASASDPLAQTGTLDV
jgi:hypothetical protein